MCFISINATILSAWPEMCFILIKESTELWSESNTQTWWEPMLFSCAELGRHDSSPKLKPKHLDRPLVAGCSMGHKPRSLYVSRWDMGQTKNSKYKSNIFFPKMVSVISGSSYHTDVGSSVHFPDKFGFNQLLNAIKRRCDVMIDSCSEWSSRGGLLRTELSWRM